jgi:hypothetical protein
MTKRWISLFEENESLFLLVKWKVFVIQRKGDKRGKKVIKKLLFSR